MLTVAAASGLLAESETGKAGPLGLLIILLLLAAVFLLGRSMTTHLRRVPAFTRLEYEAFEALANKEGERIVLTVPASFDEPTDTAGGPDTPSGTGTDQGHTV